jgi:hypothetical protein
MDIHHLSFRSHDRAAEVSSGRTRLRHEDTILALKQYELKRRIWVAEGLDAFLSSTTMGLTQSIFYPDNPSRCNRAQELANDCQYILDQYNAGKQKLEAELGPYKEKLNRVLQAFGCNDIDAFDRLILESATGDALAHWQRVRESYDRSQM